MTRPDPFVSRRDGLDAARGILRGLAIVLPFWLIFMYFAFFRGK